MIGVRHKFRDRSRAFTLVEVLIATAIFAVVVAAMNGVFYSAMRLRSKTTDVLERSGVAQHATTILRRDLRSVMAPGGVLAGPIRWGGASGQEQAERLELYCASGVMRPGEPWPDLQRVDYYLAASLQSTNLFGKDLIRAITRNLLADPQAAPDEQVLLSGVSSMQLAFYDGTQWQESWDSTTQDPAVPRAIRCRIDFAGDRLSGLSNSPIQLVIPLVVQGRTNAVSGSSTNGAAGAGGPAGGGGGGGDRGSSPPPVGGNAGGAAGGGGRGGAGAGGGGRGGGP